MYNSKCNIFSLNDCRINKPSIIIISIIITIIIIIIIIIIIMTHHYCFGLRHEGHTESNSIMKNVYRHVMV